MLSVAGFAFRFCLGMSRKNNEIERNTFLLLLMLLYILYNTGFKDIVLAILDEFPLLDYTVIDYKPQPLPRLLLNGSNYDSVKILLNEPDTLIPLPVEIIADPFVTIDTEILGEKPRKYQFTLFKFYFVIFIELKP